MIYKRTDACTADAISMTMGPWLFILMNDEIDVTNTELWKYVDDTTIAEPVTKNQASRIQASVNELVTESNENKLQLNESKCIRKCEFLLLKLLQNSTQLLSTRKLFR